MALPLITYGALFAIFLPNDFKGIITPFLLFDSSDNRATMAYLFMPYMKLNKDPFSEIYFSTYDVPGRIHKYENKYGISFWMDNNRATGLAEYLSTLDKRSS